MTSTFLYGANVHANGIRQHYLRYGGAGQRPLLLIPGITSPAATWGFVAERLGATFDTYVLDVRGRGLSEGGAGLDYGLDACAGDVGALATALGLERYILLGHSMGARIAIRAVRRCGTRVAKLILVDPPVSGPGRRRYPAQLSWYIDSIRLARRGVGAAELLPFPPTWTDEQLRLRAEWLHTCDEAAVVAAYDGFHQDDVHRDLPHLGVDTLLVVAGKGGVILPDDIAEISGLLPAVNVKSVEGVGHMIPWDDFEGFFRAIEPFLRG